MSAIEKRHPLAMDIVAQHWGDNAPEWINTLARYCDAESQASAARKIDRSPSLINQVLKNKYTGDLVGVEARVKSALSVTCVFCPVLGNIQGDECLSHQGTAYNPSNHVAVRLFVACKRCPNNVSKKAVKNVAE